MMTLRALNKELFDTIRMDYRNLHSIPEIHDELPLTRQYILDQLDEFDLNIREDVGNHGIVATLSGEEKGGCIGWRADMDALPMEEKTQLPFRSRHTGAMHACGHDAHVAIALGIIRILDKHRHLIRGHVKFLFQPAEESTGGAEHMINDKALKEPSVDRILGLHVWPSLEKGQVGLAKKELMAGGLTLKFHIQGKGGHAGRPHDSVNPIVVAAKLVDQIESIKNYVVPSHENLVITMGMLQSGSVFNVIPDEAIMHGTVRYFNWDLKEVVVELIRQICRSLDEMLGSHTILEVIENYPPTNNDEQVIEEIDQIIDSFEDYESVDIKIPSMGSEDFSFFLNEVPGSFVWLGMRQKDTSDYFEIHHPKFTVNEQIFLDSPALFSQIIIEMLQSL